jgi:hypothetical protein
VTDYVLRFIIGGAFVTLFAILGDMFKPKSFAGLLGAAPSIGLATLSIAVVNHGNMYAGVEGKSMVLGAIAFLIYAYFVGRVLLTKRVGALLATSSFIVIWLIVAFSLWAIFLKDHFAY